MEPPCDEQDGPEDNDKTKGLEADSGTNREAQRRSIRPMKPKSEPGTEQADLTQKFGPLEPYLILRRNDGSFVVPARDENGVIVIAPLIGIPDPPRRKLIQCPCPDCGRWLVWSEWPDGHATLAPFKPHPGDGGDGERARKDGVTSRNFFRRLVT